MSNKLLEKIQAEINENKILQTLQEEYPIKELLEFNEFNVGEKLQWNSYYQEQFRLLYISEKQKLDRIIEKFDQKSGEQYDYYKYKGSKDLTKTEIERYYLPTDNELIKLKRMIKLQETRVSFFEAVVESFKSQGFNMRNFLENLKIGG